jgi:ribosome biogenesis GTPase
LTERSEREPRQPLLAGLVVASFGRHHLVELPDAAVLECGTRARRHDVSCGDRVRVAKTGQRQGVIEEVAPRSTLLYRSDAQRQKLICANATQAVIVVAAVPEFNHDLVNRCLAAAEHAGMSALLVLNKSDLPQTAAARASLQVYDALGYHVATVCAKRDLQPLRPNLEGKVNVLVGQSGMGKSTMVNRLVPEAAARIGELSRALGSGRHTTTHTRLYRLNATTAIIDSPGVQTFGLHHIDCAEAAHAFREFRAWLGQCRFRDCRHLAEPGCALTAAHRMGHIAGDRLVSYRRLCLELLQARSMRPPKAQEGAGSKRY